MEQRQDHELPGDLSALAWVQDELRRTLDNAHKSLRRQLRHLELQPNDEAAAQPALLQARTLFHQGVGALDVIGLPVPARVLRGAELAVHRMASGELPCSLANVTTIERTSFAVLDFLSRQLAGKSAPALSLFPQFRDVMALAAADRIHPADLWTDVPSLPADAAAAAPGRLDPRARPAIESRMLRYLRGNDAVAEQRLADQFDRVAHQAGEGRLGALWTLAAAFFEAQAAGLLPSDLYAKRLASRLLVQLRAVERGHTDCPDRLLQDLLFFCARARRDEARAPRLAAVAQRFGLPALEDVDYESSALGRYDPALIPVARRRVAALKDTWSSVAAGELAALSGLHEQSALVGDSIRQIYSDGERLATALQAATESAVLEGRTPSTALAMEVATTLLCLDASLDDVDPEHPELQGRIQQVAQRLETVTSGQPAPPLEPWVEALYREVSDRQSMGSVVQELRATLAEIEQQLDRFNRQPDDRAPLVPVPGQLNAMRGVLSVLGLDQAAQAVQRMRDDVDAVLEERAQASRATEELADNLGALSFLVDMLGVQPQLAKSLFRFDPQTGRFAALMGQARAVPRAPSDEPRLLDQVQTLARSVEEQSLSAEDLGRHLEGLADQAVAADHGAVAQAVSQAREVLAQAQDGDDADAARAEVAQALAALTAPAPAPVPAPAPALGDDDDMREIFIEEAREVVEQAREGLGQLGADPADSGAMTVVRRAFHTLKGSSRMVGLRDFGEAAWACEQLYNTRLAEAAVQADDALRGFTARALDGLADWVEAIAAGQDETGRGEALIAEAQQLRLGAAEPPVAEPAPELPAEQVVEQAAEPPLAEAPAWAAETQPLPVLEAAEVAGNAWAATEPAGTQPELPEPVEPPDADEGWSATSLEVPADLREPSVDLELELDVDLSQFAPAPGDGLALNLIDSTGAPLDEPAADLSPEGLPAESAGPDDGLVLPDELVLDALPEVTEAPLSEPLPEPVEVPELVEVAEVAEPVEMAADDLPEPAQAAAPEPVASPDVAPEDDAERYKVVGPLRIQIALFNIYLNEADEQSRRLCTELSEWQLELDRPVGETAVALAHSLAGNSATVGFQDLSALARRLEHALERSHGRGAGQPDEATLYLDVAEEIRRLLHQFAAGFLKPVDAELLERLTAHEAEEVALHDRLAAEAEALAQAEVQASEAAYGTLNDPLEDAALPAEPEPVPEPEAEPAPVPVAVNPLGEVSFRPLEAASQAPLVPVRASEAKPRGAEVLGEHIEADDAVDPDLFEIFAEEGAELLPQLAEHLRGWEQTPDQPAAGVAAMRVLHTFKGGARLAGAMRLGEMAHRLESAVERQTARDEVDAAVLAQLHQGVDQLTEEFDRLRSGEPAPAPVPEPVPLPELAETLVVAVAAEPPPAEADVAAEVGEAPAAAPAVAPEPAPAVQIDWTRLAQTAAQVGEAQAGARPTDLAAAGSVRVRAPLLDRMVSHAGEVGIARARMETDVAQMQGSLRDLTDNLERLRRQLRDLELQAETQMASRIEAARSSQQSFDPLEMDRFTRVQELTRMMAESVADVGTVQRSLLQTLQDAEDQLAMQARLARDLQDDLLRARMVEFDTLSDRLYRVVRQAAKETGKQVRLNLAGGGIEMDRAVLDRIAPALEHLLRNAVVHGIEAPALREALGKPAIGSIDIVLVQSGNEVQVDVRDDGAGLNLARIADRAQTAGLLAPDSRPTEAELAALIFAPGFTTADEVTELAGRGVGMDVVRTDVTAMGGRIETASTSGQGTAFRMTLPLTTAVTQVVLLQAGSLVVGVPSTLVETVRRVPAAEVVQAYQSGTLRHGDADLPFFWLGSLLQESLRGVVEGRTVPIVIVRSADQRVAVHVGDIVGNQEVVVKNLGPQLSRLPGLAGMSVRASGETVLIYNPVALVAVYGAQVRQALLTQAPAEDAEVPVVEVAEPVQQAPLVLVVDDSLTVRRVTQRLLQREGYRVALAKDGLEALERLADEVPAVMLCDIEMPRMDGFDLVRNVRGDVRLAPLPVVMITSRIAAKHQEHARELGVDHYLGKPYDEEQLLALVAAYAQAAQASHAA